MHEPMLAGLKILDLTRALAGPTCTRMLVEMGAEVIKVEAAPGGDLTRHTTKYRGPERSLYYIQQNRGKKSVCIDVRKPEGLALVHEMVKHVDVVVENFKPGVIKDMGLGFEALQAIKPGMILCSISALGQSGPLSSKPGYDYIAQAYAGVTAMIGEADQPPYIPLLGVGDVSTGVHGALAILAALRYRDRTGRGQHLDVGLLDVYYHCHEVNVITSSSTTAIILSSSAARSGSARLTRQANSSRPSGKRGVARRHIVGSAGLASGWACDRRRFELQCADSTAIQARTSARSPEGFSAGTRPRCDRCRPGP